MPPGVRALAYSFNYGLVALSALIRIFTSYAALDLAGRVTAAHGRSRAIWLAGGATAMGFRIWSMRYIGMLAFRLPVPLFFEGHARQSLRGTSGCRGGAARTDGARGRKVGADRCLDTPRMRSGGLAAGVGCLH